MRFEHRSHGVQGQRTVEIRRPITQEERVQEEMPRPNPRFVRPESTKQAARAAVSRMRRDDSAGTARRHLSEPTDGWFALEPVDCAL